MVYVAARLLVTGAWPSLVQDFMVNPNELGFETPYLEANIEATRDAYALEQMVRLESTAQIARGIRKQPVNHRQCSSMGCSATLTTYGQLQENAEPTTISPMWMWIDMSLMASLDRSCCRLRGLNYNSVFTSSQVLGQ